MRHSVMLVLPAMILAGCSGGPPELVPAPSANEGLGGMGAVASAENVTLEASTSAWEGNPGNLAEAVTPVLVQVRNNADRPIQVRYNHFQLRTADGTMYEVMPPFEVNESVTRPVTTVNQPFYPVTGFSVAPYLHSYYPGYSPYAGVFAYQPYYYDPYVTVYRDINLPTGDMIMRALPEGVLDPGGTMQGFLYFQRVSDDAEAVRLTLNLVDPESEQKFGQLAIRYVVRD